MGSWLIRHCINGGGALIDKGIYAWSISGFKFHLCSPLSVLQGLPHRTDSRGKLSDLAGSADSNGITFAESSETKSLPDDISETVASGAIKFQQILQIAPHYLKAKTIRFGYKQQ